MQGDVAGKIHSSTLLLDQKFVAEDTLPDHDLEASYLRFYLTRKLPSPTYGEKLPLNRSYLPEIGIYRDFLMLIFVKWSILG